MDGSTSPFLMMTLLCSQVKAVTCFRVTSSTFIISQQNFLSCQFLMIPTLTSIFFCVVFYAVHIWSQFDYTYTRIAGNNIYKEMQQQQQQQQDITVNLPSGQIEKISVSLSLVHGGFNFAFWLTSFYLN